jgi:hypothetical protein
MVTLVNFSKSPDFFFKEKTHHKSGKTMPSINQSHRSVCRAGRSLAAGGGRRRRTSGTVLQC